MDLLLVPPGHPGQPPGDPEHLLQLILLLVWLPVSFVAGGGVDGSTAALRLPFENQAAGPVSGGVEVSPTARVRHSLRFPVHSRLSLPRTWIAEGWPDGKGTTPSLSRAGFSFSPLLVLSTPSCRCPERSSEVFPGSSHSAGARSRAKQKQNSVSGLGFR